MLKTRVSIDIPIILIVLYCIHQINCVVISQNESDIHKVLAQKNRIVQRSSDIRRLPHSRYQEQRSRIRQGSDVFPLRSQLNSQSFPHQQHSMDFRFVGPQILRRAQSIPTSSKYFNLENHHGDAVKSSRFSSTKNEAFNSITKNTLFRQEPNAIPPSFSEQYIQNFKASPFFNGNVIVKDQRHPEYSTISQHPIPKKLNGQYAQFGYQTNTGVVSPEQQFQYANSNSGDHKIKEPLLNYNPNPIQPVQKYIVSKEAQDYLKFMSQNEYFLPKRDPNYKQLDVESDRNQYIQHQQYQQYQQRQHHLTRSSSNLNSDNSITNTYNEPIKVANLFHQEDTGTPSGRYQTENNPLIVKSDDKKTVKQSLYSSPTTSFTTPPLYNQKQYAQNSQTPQPIRLEFTEKDAVSSLSYTNSPELNQSSISQKVDISTKSPIIKPVTEVEDDSEDSLDIHQGNMFPIEQKGSEEYCERICSNVYDENDEIICGSDGYMYTGKAQLECYSSCLQISVSINSKGLCSPI